MKRYPHYIIDLARKLRQRQTEAEKLLWQRLRKYQLNDLKFRRQHHIGRYIADFYCDELKLVIELEGGIHEMNTQKKYDRERFQELEARGLRILRVRNEEVQTDVEKVLRKILDFRKLT